MRSLAVLSRLSAVVLILGSGASRALAAPGELDSVIQHCGMPHAQNTSTSEVTGRPERSLIYNSVILHFEPQQSGWQFTTAWEGHFPVTRASLEEKLPCFRAAMYQADLVRAPAVDPTIAAQTTTPVGFSQSNFDIPHLWLIVVLIAILVLIVVVPRRGRQQEMVMVPEQRRVRKPLVEGRFFRSRRGPNP